MSVKVIIGLQWGDEGKGKIVDVFSSHADLVVRYQGGSNAGHTIVIKDKKFVLHAVPSGILRKDLTCLVARGLVVDPESLLEEIDALSKRGISAENRLFISRYVHVVLPYHKLLDELIDKDKGENKIGTTKRGIGPCYADKIYRSGIRMEDLLDLEILKDKLYRNLEVKNKIISQVYGGCQIDAQVLYKKYSEYGKKLKPYICDCHDMIYRYLKDGKRILYEGAQGTLLDIDYGTYPYVTSSNSSSAGIFTGGSLPLGTEYDLIGVFKAYTTRVGEGPFPTEFDDELSQKIRTIGKEYGASTGRPRRCGWFDAFALKYSCIINGVGELVLTKLDVLDELDKIKICKGYKYKGEDLEYFSPSSLVLDSVEPVYEEYPGWMCSTKDVRNYDELPENAKKYISRIEELLDKRIDMVSIGSKRSEIIKR